MLVAVLLSACTANPVTPAAVPTLTALAVNVTDPAGTPIALATVTVTAIGSGQLISGHPSSTDLNGNAIIPVPVGEGLGILVAKSGYAPYGWTLTLKDRTSLYVTLGRLP